jgi:hypothetical protein
MRYAPWVSIEMRQPADAGSSLGQVETALAYVKSVYGD